MADNKLSAICAKANELGVTTTEFWRQVKRLELAQTNIEEAALEVLSDLRAGGVTCPKCEGTGLFHFRDGRVGPCYACKGKGFTDVSDVRRNFGYRKHQPGRQEAYYPTRDRS